jgi:hypothetical protein
LTFFWRTKSACAVASKETNSSTGSFD